MPGPILSTNLASQVVTVFADKAVDILSNAIVMANLVNRHYDNTGDVGQTVNVPIPATGLVADMVSEGGSVVLDQTGITTAAITINKHATKTFQINDVTRVLTNLDLLDLYMKGAVIAVAEQVEADLAGLYTGISQTSGTGSVGLTSAVVDTAETTLFNSKVPANDMKYLVVNGAAYGQIRQLPEFANAYQYGPEPDGSAWKTGYVGKIKGAQVFRSQSIKFVAGAPNTTHNLFFHPDAFALVTRPLPLPIEGTGAVASYINYNGINMRLLWSFNPTVMAQQFTVSCFYGVGVLRAGFAVDVKN
jgi:hypothetical protein